MAASQLRPARATASICSLDKETGEHTFEIRDYSHQTNLDRGYILSERFTVGGHDWRIRYYPDGTGNGENGNDYVGVQLELMSVFTKVRLSYEFRLVGDQAPTMPTMTVLTAENPSCGTDTFKKKIDLRRFLWNDSLKIHCVVTVIKEAQLRETAVSSYRVDVEVPRSTLSSDLGNLLTTGKDADITFKVRTSEVFHAHKIIIDMRCPALRTSNAQPQLDGQNMRDRRTPIDNSSSSIVAIDDMEPAAFKALLHFIYTDSLPKEYKNEENAKNLLPAAHKYGMGRMKLYCGRILSDRLTVHSVADTIALAHQYHCRELKDACIQFILSSTKTGAGVISIEGCEELELNHPEVVLEILKKSGIFKKPSVERRQNRREGRQSAANHRGEGRRRQGGSHSMYLTNNVASNHWSSDDQGGSPSMYPTNNLASNHWNSDGDDEDE